MIFIKCPDCIIDMNECWGIKIEECENEITDAPEFIVVAFLKAFEDNDVPLGRFKDRAEALHLLDDIHAQIMHFYGFL